MAAETFFFDTSALIEIFLGNKAYIPYLHKRIMLTQLNLFELYYFFLKNFSLELAEQEFKKYCHAAVPLEDAILRKSAQWRLKYKKVNFSMTDAIGYATALAYGVHFLTRDSGFRTLPYAEFVR